jgi:hypothetical protein
MVMALKSISIVHYTQICKCTYTYIHVGTYIHNICCFWMETLSEKFLRPKRSFAKSIPGPCWAARWRRRPRCRTPSRWRGRRGCGRRRIGPELSSLRKPSGQIAETWKKYFDELLQIAETWKIFDELLQIEVTWKKIFRRTSSITIYVKRALQKETNDHPTAFSFFLTDQKHALYVHVCSGWGRPLTTIFGITL